MELSNQVLFLCLSGGMRLIKTSFILSGIAKTITCFIRILDNKINSLKTSFKKGRSKSRN